MAQKPHNARIDQRDGEFAFSILAMLIAKDTIARPMVIALVEELGGKMRDVTADECEDFIHSLRAHAHALEISSL